MKDGMKIRCLLKGANGATRLLPGDIVKVSRTAEADVHALEFRRCGKIMPILPNLETGIETNLAHLTDDTVTIPSPIEKAAIEYGLLLGLASGLEPVVIDRGDDFVWLEFRDSNAN